MTDANLVAEMSGADPFPALRAFRDDNPVPQTELPNGARAGSTGWSPASPRSRPRLLDDMAGRDEVDLVDAYAFPLPIQVICEPLGVPVADRDSVRSWSNTLVSAGLASDANLVAEVRTVVAQLVVYIVNLLANKRSSPGDDLLSALVDVRDDSDRLSEEELVAMVLRLAVVSRLAVPAANLQWRPGILIRGLVHLPVRLS